MKEDLFKWPHYATHAGKGDTPRPIDKQKFQSNFDSIKGRGKMSGKVKRQRNGRTTYSY